MDAAAAAADDDDGDSNDSSLYYDWVLVRLGIESSSDDDPYCHRRYFGSDGATLVHRSIRHPQYGHCEFQ
jgi:hypothetical protein